ncbi:unnamed protein product [Dimorphilus gyrociliatus]|uniref:Potassium channel domain-containing protein n=1 Tax=Dimorphilus gyrociliatus TaxID=2664684 RepID=A0A7I8VE55_9ANNE|nr:unnamed protein product [Dimorphilus gyrociliatus]
MFQSIGERLNVFITFLMRHCKRCMKLRNQEVSQTNLIIVGLNLCLVVLTTGAVAYSYYEEWSYLNSFYYCFITLTTIGFGDYVALQKNSVLQTKPEYVAFSLIFILFGLTVVGAAMNLLVLRFLTMNTEDERREELEAAAAARTAVRLDGDVITANGSIISGQHERPEYVDDTISVCSCSCYAFRDRSITAKRRYTVRRSPSQITRLVRAIPVCQDDDVEAIGNPETNSMLNYLRNKRASI